MRWLSLLLVLLPAIVAAREPAAADPPVCAAYRAAANAESATSPAPQVIPFGRGLLWRVDRPGTPASYVFGTIHVDTPALTHLPDPVQQALARTDRLVVETQIDDRAQAIYNRRAYLPRGRTLASLLSATLLHAYLNIAAEYGVPAETAIRLAPWAATNLIGRPNQNSGPTLEDVLQAEARSAGKPIFGLETMTELLDTLAGMSRRDQLEILNDTICNHDRILREAGELEEIYARHDLAAMMAFNDRGHNDPALFDRYQERMLYGRSQRMVRRLVPQLQTGRAFIAVGALHLTGERGVLRLLERRGYRITAEF